VECARKSGSEERGWVAVPLDERAEGGELLISSYCPDCARREFGRV
jgi:hypothetical protein